MEVYFVDAGNTTGSVDHFVLMQSSKILADFGFFL
jgi:hypothetical protein